MDGPAVFYDGLTARRHCVRVEIADGHLVIADESGIESGEIENGEILRRWAFADLRRQDAPDDLLRLAAEGAPELARLEIPAGPLAEAALACLSAERRLTTPNNTWRIIAWSMAAAASLILSALILVPRIADALAPLVPDAVEERLGDAVDHQFRAMFKGAACDAPDGQAALTALVAKLNSVAGLPGPLRIGVLPSPQANAMTLPGGRIYLLGGLMPTLASPDELAGILAHEMGHAAHRDGLRKLLQTGGSSFLLGLLFGDVGGAGSLIMVGRSLIDSSYSREAELAADAFAAKMMIALGRPAQPLGDWLWRMAQQRDGNSDILAVLRSHPHPDERAAALAQIGMTHVGPPLMSAEAWKALQSICKTP